ncbi:MAG: glycosyltransferase family 4 protein [Cyanobacteria bacterium J06554_11]
MKILFLDQSGTLGGAELCLLDIAAPYRHESLMGLLSDGPFRERLEQQGFSTKVFTTEAIDVRKESGFLKSLSSLGQLFPLVQAVADTAREYDLIYANTPKALVVGAFASLLSRRPLAYHLHDIIASEHFSKINRIVLITLANRFASRVIANSEASQRAFVAAGGRSQLCKVIYNGFHTEQYDLSTLGTAIQAQQLRDSLGLGERFFLVGHFSRLSPWKGQHVLLDAVKQCPPEVVVILVGDALFGEQAYVKQLHEQVDRLELGDRVRFLGFRSDIPELMSACDLVVHTSTAPEPFGRVIVEAMLCGTPVIAAAAGGATELVSPGRTGWLCAENEPSTLAETILNCKASPDQMQEIAQQAKAEALSRFDVNSINRLIQEQLNKIVR